MGAYGRFSLLWPHGSWPWCAQCIAFCHSYLLHGMALSKEPVAAVIPCSSTACIFTKTALYTAFSSPAIPP